MSHVKSIRFSKDQVEQFIVDHGLRLIKQVGARFGMFPDGREALYASEAWGGHAGMEITRIDPSLESAFVAFIRGPRPPAGSAPAAAAPAPKTVIPGRIVPGTYRQDDECFDFIVQVMGLAMVHRSYPNGSSYDEIIPCRLDSDRAIDGWYGGYVYNGGQWIHGPDGQEYRVRLSVARGPGVDLGVHFYNRDDRWDGLAIEVID